jgi:hypothetical protein
MRFCLRRLQFVLVCLIAFVTLLPAALAQNADQSQNATPATPPATPKPVGAALTHFGSDITVEANQQVADVTCFGCSVRIRGQVAGDVTVFAGGITIEEEGEVAGDVTNFGSGVRLDRSTKVGGDVTVFGGGVRRDADASVGGDVTNFKGPIWMFLIFGLPLVVLAGITIFIVWLVRRLTRPSVPVAA